MNTTCERKENSLVVFDVEVEQDEFENYKSKAYIKQKSKYKIPGFRVGKAPRSLIERDYGKGVFVEEGFNILLNDAYMQAVNNFEIVPVSEPDVDLKSMDDDGKILFSISVTVEPEVELCEYKGIEVHVDIPEVTAEQVDESILSIADKNSRLVEVEDRDIVEKNDIIYIKYTETADDSMLEEVMDENLEVELGKGNFVQEFEENLIGLKIGEPAEFKLEKVNIDGGERKLTYNVTVMSIKTKILPEIDDNFAQDVSEYDTLDEYKQSLENILKKERDAKIKRHIEENILNYLKDNCKIEIPEVMIETEAKNTYKYMEYMVSQVYKMNFAQYLSIKNQTKQELEDEMNDMAINNVKVRLIMKAIHKKETLANNQEGMDKDLHASNGEFKEIMNMLVENAKIIQSMV